MVTDHDHDHDHLDMQYASYFRKFDSPVYAYSRLVTHVTSRGKKMRSYDVGVWLAVLFTAVTSDTINPVDYLWPIPYSVKCDPGLQYGIDDATFTFQGSGQGGELPTLTSAFERYRPFIVPDTMKAKNPNVKLGVDMLEMLEVNVVSNDETLALETDESCEHPNITLLLITTHLTQIH